MKKFCFPLRSVATLRGLREQRARELFASAIQVCVLAEERLGQVRGRLADLDEAMRSERTFHFRVADQIAFLQTHQHEKQHEVEILADLKRAETERERRRLAWLTARRDVRLIEALEGKARVAHRIEGDREAQNLMDDRSASLFARSH